MKLFSFIFLIIIANLVFVSSGVGIIIPNTNRWPSYPNNGGNSSNGFMPGPQMSGQPYYPSGGVECVDCLNSKRVLLPQVSPPVIGGCFTGIMKNAPAYNPWGYQAYYPWGYQAYYPWLSYYGNTRWQNYSTPGLIDRPYVYPGDGGMMAMKPNVYISGKIGTSFNIDIEFVEGGNLLVASPALSKGWRGKIVSNGKVEVDHAIYPYLYYDYRAGKDSLQLENGFCGSKESVISKMRTLLENVGFRSIEIGDFSRHWPEKLPISDSYCIFPQDNEQLSQKVQLNITPVDYHLVQLNFVVVLKKGKYKDIKAKKYLINKKFTSKRTADDLEIREWGVIFLTD